MKAVPTFWSKLNQNPVAVEASIGLRELYPLTPIVPLLPPALHAQCVALESLLAEEQRIYAELNSKAKQGNHLRKIITESVTEEGLLELAQSSLVDGWTTNSLGTTNSMGNTSTMGESFNVGRDNDDVSRGDINDVNEGGHSVGSNTVGGGMFSQQREQLKSRQRFAADLT